MDRQTEHLGPPAGRFPGVSVLGLFDSTVFWRNRSFLKDVSNRQRTAPDQASPLMGGVFVQRFFGGRATSVRRMGTPCSGCSTVAGSHVKKGILWADPTEHLSLLSIVLELDAIDAWMAVTDHAAAPSCTIGKCRRPASYETSNSSSTPGLPFTKAQGRAHREPRGQRGRGSNRGRRLAGKRW